MFDALIEGDNLSLLIVGAVLIAIYFGERWFSRRVEPTFARFDGSYFPPALHVAAENDNARSQTELDPNTPYEHDRETLPPTHSHQRVRRSA